MVVAAGLGNVAMVADIFQANQGGGEAMAEAAGVPFLGRVPLDPALGKAAEAGVAIGSQDPQAPAAKALDAIISNLIERLETEGSESTPSQSAKH